MEHTILDADHSHLPGILVILNDVIRTSTAIYTEQEWALRDVELWFDERKAGGHPVLVAVAKDKVIGYGSYVQFRAKVGYRNTMEHTVYLAQEARGQGLGSELLMALEARARAQGHHVMVGGIDSENLGSIAFHARHGYTKVGRMPEVGQKFGRWLTLVLMQKGL